MLNRLNLTGALVTAALTGGLAHADVVTQSTDPATVTPAHSVSCNSGGLHAENSYYRLFDMSAMGTAGTLNSVNFGIESAIGNGGNQPVLLRISELTTPPLSNAGLTLLHEELLTVADTSASLLDVALAEPVEFNPALGLLVELLTPDGQVDGHTFFIGSNAAGQSAPGFIRAPDCGITEPTDLAAIGFSTMHMVMSIDVDVVNCGDGILDAGEACDDANLVDGDGCDSNCTVTACGNGVTTAGEGCDDGNLVDDDDCDSNCTLTACGNGIVTGTEGCDDGNLVDGDDCDSNCTVTGCGNGVVTGNEACDDGGVVDGDGCDSNCTATGCGNGIVTGTEACDDGGVVAGDGCSATCAIELPPACGDGTVDAGEACDDDNVVDGDGCSATCQIEAGPACGDGTVDAGEQCDDGNTTSGDGCTDACRTEADPPVDGEGGGCCQTDDRTSAPTAGLMLLMGLAWMRRRRRGVRASH